MFSSGKVEAAGLDLWKMGLSGTEMQRNVRLLKKSQTCSKPGIWRVEKLRILSQSDSCYR